MIYSRWRPDTGGFDYFESSERFGLGDDLPVPSLPRGTAIGVSSVLCGRTPRSGSLSPVGSGPAARGVIMPTSRAGLSGGGLSSFPAWFLVAIGAAGAWTVFIFRKKRS